MINILAAIVAAGAFVYLAFSLSAKSRKVEQYSALWNNSTLSS